MKRRTLRYSLSACILSASILSIVSYWAPNGAAARPDKPARVRGVSLAGPEFGVERRGFCNQSPGVFGRDYTWNTERTTQYFCENGVNLLRLPIRWERIQPRLGEALDSRELARLRVSIGWAKKHGGMVVIDLHNQGRYVMACDGKPKTCVIDQKWNGQVALTRDHFADLWRRLALAFRDEQAIYGYGLMNEPHDMGSSNWKEISQSAVDAIREIGDSHKILVAGDGWSKAHGFEAANGPASWIDDPAGNFAYEAHCYFDADGSGRYEKSYDQEVALGCDPAERAGRRLRSFAEWCARNRVQGFIGEYSVPGNDPRWLKVLERFQTTLDEVGMDGCYWAGGEWWKDESWAIQPRDGFRTDAPQLQALLKY
jgi:endoglucanase